MKLVPVEHDPFRVPAMEIARRGRRGFADGGMPELQHTRPFPEAPEGYEFTSPEPKQLPSGLTGWVDRGNDALEPDENAAAARDRAALSVARAAAPGSRSESLVTRAPEAIGQFGAHALNDLAHLPEKAFGASEQMRLEGEYNPKPVLEGALLPWGASAPFRVPARAGEALLGAGPVRTSAENAPKFYSALEQTIAEIPQTRMPAEQWLGSIANKPGVKPEEI